MRHQDAYVPVYEKGSFNTASGMRSHVTALRTFMHDVDYRFNTASGMRSHVTSYYDEQMRIAYAFQYRKRYEVTCDINNIVSSSFLLFVSIPQAV